jgi:hypothetical protein
MAGRRWGFHLSLQRLSARCVAHVQGILAKSHLVPLFKDPPAMAALVSESLGAPNRGLNTPC